MLKLNKSKKTKLVDDKYKLIVFSKRKFFSCPKYKLAYACNPWIEENTIFETDDKNELRLKMAIYGFKIDRQYKIFTVDVDPTGNAFYAELQISKI